MNTNDILVLYGVLGVLWLCPGNLTAQDTDSRVGTGIPVPMTTVSDGASPSLMLQWVKRLRNAGVRPASEFQVDRLYDVSRDLHPLTFGLWGFRPTHEVPFNQEWSKWWVEIGSVLRDVGILGSDASTNAGASYEYSAEWSFVYQQYADRLGVNKAVDGTPYTTVIVFFGVCRSGTREDIDDVYYLARHFPLIAARPTKGISEDPDEVVVGDACYRYGHGDNQTNGRSPIGFLRGNVVVEIHATSHVWRTRNVPAGGVIEAVLDPSLPDKVIEAARRIDQLLMKKMFDEPTRAKIVAAERARANKKPTKR